MLTIPSFGKAIFQKNLFIIYILFYDCKDNLFKPTGKPGYCVYLLQILFSIFKQMSSWQRIITVYKNHKRWSKFDMASYSELWANRIENFTLHKNKHVQIHKRLDKIGVTSYTKIRIVFYKK